MARRNSDNKQRRADERRRDREYANDRRRRNREDSAQNRMRNRAERRQVRKEERALKRSILKQERRVKAAIRRTIREQRANDPIYQINRAGKMLLRAGGILERFGAGEVIFQSGGIVSLLTQIFRGARGNKWSSGQTIGVLRSSNWNSPPSSTIDFNAPWEPPQLTGRQDRALNGSINSKQDDESLRRLRLRARVYLEELGPNQIIEKALALQGRKGISEARQLAVLRQALNVREIEGIPHLEID